MTVTVEQYLAGVNENVAITLTTGAGTQAGWWLVVVQAWDIGTLAAMPASPTGTAGTWTLLETADAGVGGPRLKAWARRVETGGAQTVTLAYDPGHADNHVHLWVLSGVRAADDIDQIISTRATASLAQATALVAPAQYAPDDSGDLLLCVWVTYAAATNYTLPAGMTGHAELDFASTSRAAEQSITVHGGTGPRTATASASLAWAAISLLVRPITGAVTFPATALGIRVELALDADPGADPRDWADLWTQVGDGDEIAPVTINRGRADESSTASPSSCTLALKNVAGKYTRLQPLSPYYGRLTKNTPLRVWVNPGSGWDIRYTGFVSEWPPRQQGGGADERMPVVANGLTRRLSQGRVLRSALYRALTSVSTPWRAYWPLEDGITVRRAATGVPGGQPMWMEGKPQFQADGPVGATGAVSLDTQGGARLIGAVIGQPGGAGWAVSCWLTLPFFDPNQQQPIALSWYTPDAITYTRYVLHAGDITRPGKIVLQRFDASGNPDPVYNPILVSTRDMRGVGPTLVTVNGWENPSTGAPEWDLYLGGVQDVATGGPVGESLAPLRSISITPPEAMGACTGTISHLAVTEDDRLADLINISSPAGLGFATETAADRITRLSAEEQVPIVIRGSAAESAAMGPQGVQQYLSLLRECEAVDGGVLYERRDGRLGYQTRADRYNRAPAITVDPAGVAPPFEPTDDDQRTRNDVEATRPDGSSARVSDDTHIAAVGRYDDSVSLNVATDDQLADQAGWRVHLGTNDDLRFPSIALNLNGQPALIPEWVNAEVGDVIAITNPPRDLPPDTIKTFIEGYTETIDAPSWTVTANCSPARPYDVAVLEGTAHTRADTDGSATVAAITAGTDTTLRVTATAPDAPAWTKDPADLPLNITAAGVELQVTAVADAATDAFGRTVANGWGSGDTGGSWTVSGGTAADYAVGSGIATAALATVNVPRLTLLPAPSADIDLTASVGTNLTATGASLWAGLLVRAAEETDWYSGRLEFTTGQQINAQIVKKVGGTATQLASVPTSLTHTAGTLYRLRVQAIGTLLRVKAWTVGDPEPTTWHGSAIDTDLTAAASIGTRAIAGTGNTNTGPVARYDDLAVTNPQTLTVTAAPVNGVTKTIPAGSAVQLADPMILSL